MVRILIINVVFVLLYVNIVLLEVIVVCFVFINKFCLMWCFVFLLFGGFLYIESVWLNKFKYECVIFKRKILRFENIKNGFSVLYVFLNMCIFLKINKI